MAELRTVLESVLSGSSGAIALEGEPGIGKTRLLTELRGLALGFGFDVVEGRGAEYEQEMPFGIVVDALDERFGLLRTPQLSADVGERRMAELAAMLPSLADRGRGPVDRLDVERFQLYRAVRAGLGHLAKRRPHLLIFDDVHWADPASAELIGYLLRRPVPGVVPALAFRPRSVRNPLAAAIDSAMREGIVRRIAPAPLTLPEAAELLGAKATPPTIRALHTESGGNPFYLEQLARTMQYSRTAAPACGSVGVNDPGEPCTERELPAALRTAVAREIKALPADAADLLHLAAAVGDPIDVATVIEISAATSNVTLGHLDLLVSADLLRTTESAARLRFRHPVVRRVAYESTPPGARLLAHRNAARVLADRGAPLTVQAHHIARSAEVGDESAIAVLTEAGQEVAAHAPAAVAEWLTVALGLLPEGDGAARRSGLTVALATALASAGLLEQCRARLEEVLEMLSPDQTEERITISAMIVRAYHGMGLRVPARRLIDATLRDAADTPATIALYKELSVNHVMNGEWDQAVETVRHARAQAMTLGHGTAAYLSATAALARFIAYRGPMEAIPPLLDEVADHVDTHAAELDPQLLDPLTDLIFAEIGADRYHAAARHVDHGLRISRRLGHSYALAGFVLADVVTKLLLGRLTEASAAAESAVEIAISLDNNQVLSAAEASRCWVETLRGDLSTALSAGKAAVQALERQPCAFFGWLARACYGQALIEAGEYERGRYQLLRLGGSALTELPPANRAAWQLPLVVAALSAGHVDQAEAVVTMMEQTDTGLPSQRGRTLHARSKVEFARSDHAAAVTLALQSAQYFDEVGMHVWAAQARLTAGHSLAAADARTDALRELRLAHGIFDDAGAARLRDEAARALRNLGVRARRTPGSDNGAAPIQLTAREQDIAERIARGYTNRQIATELFISPKTVEKHTARVFAKLDVSSRAAVASALQRQNQ
ncbi:MAG: AAA family ATPase [Mycobacteriaceae bacterium]|nr:AAA family ATPase [Mycobacteriaceae bacterium]